MKTKLLLVFLSVFLVSSLIAQNNKTYKKTPQEKATQITAKMKKQLELKPKQVEKVQAINLKYVRLIRVARKNLKGQKAKLKQRRQQLRHERNLDLKNVLTAAQYNKYKQLERLAIEKHKNKKKTKTPVEDTNFDEFFIDE